MSNTPIIRKANKEDMHQVMKLIQELAEFEKMQSQVKINADQLIKDGFESDKPTFMCLVAEAPPDGIVVGYALYYVAYSTWRGNAIFLEDLYVQPTFRGAGVGKRLFTAVAKIAHEEYCNRLDFHVLSWNPAIAFYKSLGAVSLTETESWQLFRLPGEALDKMFTK